MDTTLANTKKRDFGEKVGVVARALTGRLRKGKSLIGRPLQIVVLLCDSEFHFWVKKRRREASPRGGAQRPPRKSTSEALGSSPRWLRGDTFESSKVHFFTLWPFWTKMGPNAKKLKHSRACSTIGTRRRAKSGPQALPRGAQKLDCSESEKFVCEK